MLTIYAVSIVACIGTVFGCIQYQKVALRKDIVATINSRSLHERAVPRGGGIVFASAFLLAFFISWLYGMVPAALLISIGGGAAAAALIGFIDDIHEIKATAKLTCHICLGVWLLISTSPLLCEPWICEYGVGNQLVILLALLMVPLWLINLYNFIDGIDGMAAAGAVFICAAAITVLVIGDGGQQFLLSFLLIGASSLGFLFFNIPPAKLFMGDAGSMFLGYCFAALLIATVRSGDISWWTWVAILGYFIGDTTTTTISRMFLVPKWYRPHRSHAYQNLARIYKSHAKVTYGVLQYHIFWALPLAISSVLWPEWGPIAAFLSLLPAMLWTIRFGPRLSSA